MLKILKIYKKIVDSLFWVIDCFCRFIVLFMVIVVFSQVVLRAFFKMNIAWGEEMVLLAMVWLTFAAMSIGIKTEGHIHIDFFMAKFPKKVKKIVVAFDHLVLFIVNIIMIYFGLKLIQLTKISFLPVTKLPASVVFYLVPVAAALSVLALFGKFFGLYKTKTTENFILGIYEDQTMEDK